LTFVALYEALLMFYLLFDLCLTAIYNSRNFKAYNTLIDDVC